MITSVSGQMLTGIKSQMIPAPGGLVMARRLLTRKKPPAPTSITACLPPGSLRGASRETV
jgi:hypothetical protein